MPATRADMMQLIPEPPTDQIEGVCTVQLRGDGVASSAARRRFDVQKATLHDLFAFARALMMTGEESVWTDPLSIRLVTRFPRKVYESGSTTLAQAGIAPGQELFMVERL